MLSGDGDFIRKPDRRVKLLVTTQVIWGAALVVLALWWGTYLRQQSDEIATLQTQIGIPERAIQNRLDRTARMVTGESGTFILLILITNGVLLYFFIRDSKRSKSLQVFFAAVTHEFRTPLTSIKLQAEALRDIEDNPKHAPYIHRLLEDVERLEGQVQKTLELARIEGGGTLNLQSVQLKNFVQHKILPQYLFAEHKLKMKIDLSSEFVLADTTALNIIFRNIIDNAIKYSASQPTEITFHGSVPKNAGDPFYLLNITHHHSNFNGDSRELGSLFYRGTNSQGAGVGLYLIQTLMKKMKGSATFSPSDQKFQTQLSFDLDRNSEATPEGGIS